MHNQPMQNSHQTESRPVGTGRLAGLVLVCCIALLAACQQNEALRIIPLAYHQLDLAAVNQLFENNSGLHFIETEASADYSQLEALTHNRADITVVENSTPFYPGVRTVIPLYPSVMHLLVRADMQLADLESSQRPLTYYVVNESNAGHSFMNLAAQRLTRVARNHQLVTQLEPGITDVIIYFGPINPQDVRWYSKGYRLISLADLDESHAEFFQEGISFLIPQLRPANIPALTYELPGNESSIQTLAVDTLLVARKNASAEAIYKLTSTLLEQKARFAAVEPNLFSWMSAKFDQEKLNFPLHDGARRYLNRDEPGPLERYAETINLLVYLLILLGTGVVALHRWRVQRQKNRVDTFYLRALAIRARVQLEPQQLLLAELDSLEREAFDLLIAEKLTADESFRIFTELVNGARTELASAAAA